jgi:hypothetical protein
MIVNGNMLVGTLHLGNLVLVLVYRHDFHRLELRILQSVVLVHKGSAGNERVRGSRHVARELFHNIVEQRVEFSAFAAREEIDQGTAVLGPCMNGEVALGQHGDRAHALRVELGALNTQ